MANKDYSGRWAIIALAAIIGAWLFSSLFGMVGFGYWPMHMGYGFGFGWVFMNLIFVALILFIVWMIKQISRDEKRGKR